MGIATVDVYYNIGAGGISLFWCPPHNHLLAIKTRYLITMGNIFKVLLISFLGYTSTCSAGEWYEGGMLTDQNALAWQDASLANKIATSADFVAVMFQNKLLKPSISNNIRSVDDLAPYAIQVAICIDVASKKQANPEENIKIYTNQEVSGMAAICATLMGWMK